MEVLSRSGHLEKVVIQPSAKKSAKKIDHEFQAVGVEMQNHFGKECSKRIWPLFYKYPLGRIKDAWLAYQKGNVKSFDYFCGILHKI